MHLLSGGTTTIYHRAAPFVSTASGLNEYSGKYRSEEVDVTFTVAPMEESIVVGTPGSWNFRAEPIFRDAFAVPDAVVVQFTRDALGHVDGMMIDMARTRNVKFRRTSD